LDIARFPRVRLGRQPTPLEPMENLSRVLGGPRLWIRTSSAPHPRPGSCQAFVLPPSRFITGIRPAHAGHATSPSATATGYGAGRGAGKLVSIVVDNGSYGTIRIHQEREYPGRISGSDLFNPDFAALARAYVAHRVDTTAEFEPVLAAAMAADGPTLIHIKLNTDVITSRTTLGAIRETAQRAGR
jgi:hypothetical protein